MGGGVYEFVQERTDKMCIRDRHYIPAVVRNCTRLADSVCKVHTACPAAPTGVQETLLCQTSELLTKAASAEHHLEGLVEQLGRMDNVHDLSLIHILHETAQRASARCECA